MSSILGDFFKKIGSGVDKLSDGNIWDGLGDILGGTLTGAGRTVGFAAKTIGKVASSTGDFISDISSEGVEDELSEEDILLLGVYAHIGMLAKMAKIDGRVSRLEIKCMEELISEWGLDEEVEVSVKNIFRETKDLDEDIFQFAELFLKVNEDDVDRRKSVYVELWRMAQADDSGAEKKIEVLRTIPRFLGLPDEIFDEVVEVLFSGADSQSEEQLSNDHYEVLGCSSDASNTEVRRCYKEKIAQYHPDVISSKDLAPGFIEFANQQAARINAAYEAIKAERGMR